MSMPVMCNGRSVGSMARGDTARAAASVAGALQRVWELGDRWGTTEQLDGIAAVLAATGHAREAGLIAGAAEAAWTRLAAHPHPADRRATDRWLLPALGQAGAMRTQALTQGRQLALEDAVEAALHLVQV